MESYTLHQLNEYIRRVIALNFREPVWIEAEIVQIKESRGNHYLELVEKKEGSGDILAQASAAIWYRNYQFIRKKLGDLTSDLFQPGSQVRLKCRVDFNERYGMKLIVEDADPNYTFGRLELKRQEIIERLNKEGLMELNKSILIPQVIQSIAVISSAQAAGYQDFVSQIRNNAYGYSFDVALYDSAVQGTKLEAETLRAIDQIQGSPKTFDCVIILRGGGSKLDLSGYDNYKIAKRIATSKLPFIVGIGHDVDQTVIDLVSCLSLKTPTAVADYLIETNLHFESALENRVAQIAQFASDSVVRHKLHLNSLSEKIVLTTRHLLEDSSKWLERSGEMLKLGVENKMKMNRMSLSHLESTIQSLDPQLVLERGFSFVTNKGRPVLSVQDASQGDRVELHFKDGSLKGQIL